MKFLETKKPVKPKNDAAAGLTVESPEENFYFVFVCKGSKAAYKQVEEFIKGRTPSRVVFQKISRNYMAVSEVHFKPISGGK
ncbi:MAG: hypothetical protein QXR42_05635 [Candidatus Bathyarchaeia archaeon]